MLAGSAAWGLLGVAASFRSDWVPVWWIIGGTWFGWALLDAMRVLLSPAPVVERILPSRFALGVTGEVRLTIRHPGRGGAWIRLFDGLPPEASCAVFPWEGRVPGRGWVTMVCPMKMLRRGQLRFEAAHVLRRSPGRCWWAESRSGPEQSVPVFPDYEPVLRYALLALANQERQMGIQQRQRRGVSREFHQLRDYQEGDLLSQVDWKATSRRLSLVSREYREQRDQNVVFLLDAGRRMRALDGELPQFDHCLNSVLLLSYLALRQGDNVGACAFGGLERWLAPVKGAPAMTTLLHHLYDYETTPEPTDFAEAADLILRRQRKRALVVLLTNVRGEDAADAETAVRILRRRHVVILASLRERSVAARRARQVRTFDDALFFGASQRYLDERREALERLRAAGATVVDATAEELPVALANAYLEVKRSGRL
jgi:uncharacterized protein (DUF58 family)